MIGTACVGEVGEGPPPYLIRDSAGLEVVENRSPVWPDGDEWSVGATLFEVGTTAGDSLDEFSWISSVRRLPTGGIAVADGASKSIRIYSADGSFLRHFGREGNGPAEFGASVQLAPVAGDSLLAWDPGRRRMLGFGLDGTFIGATSYADLLREARVPGGAGMPGEVSADARILVRALAPSADLFREEGLVERSIRPIVAAAATHSFVALEPVAAGRSLRADGRGISDPYAPYSPVTLGPPELPLIVGDETEWEIRYFDEQGDLARIVRAEIPRRSFTAEVHEGQRALLDGQESGLGMDPARLSVLFDRLPTPDSLPALDEIHRSRTGHLWVRRRPFADQNGHHLYDVLDAGGRWLGTVPVPVAIGTIHEIGSDYILAVRTDDLGVQSVTVVGLRTGAEGRPRRTRLDSDH